MPKPPRLVPRADDDVGAPRGAELRLRLPKGLSHLEETALARGRLMAAFGEPTSRGDAYKITFVFALDLVDDKGAIGAVVVNDYKGGLSAHWHPSSDADAAPEKAQRALDAALRRADAADYEALFLWDENIPYGCKWGEPWVLLGGYAEDVPRAPVRLFLEPRAVESRAPSDEELRSFYARTVPPGSPPFEELRGAVLDAWQRMSASEGEDPLAQLTAAFRGHFLAHVGEAFDQLLDETDEGLRALVTLHPGRFMDATETRTLLVRVASRLDALLAGREQTATKRIRFPLRQREGLWRAVHRELGELLYLVQRAEAEGRRVQLRRA